MVYIKKLLKKIENNHKLTILLKSHILKITYFENMQVRKIYGFGYITCYLQWRKSFEYDVYGHFKFRYSYLGALDYNNHKYIQIF